MSNSAQNPMGIALLARQKGSQNYGNPAHWDFTPMAGGSEGLILTLPQTI